VPSPVPVRDRNVYFVGAGLSCALGLPNTAMLLEGVIDLASRNRRWGRVERLDERLRVAFEYFYPDAVHEGYMPDVGDFFSALRTYLDVGSDLAGGLSDAPSLYRSLKSAIAHLLVEATRKCQPMLRAGHPYLEEMVQPGNIIVTSNWDLVVERYAQLHNVPLRLTGSSEEEVVLHKLHGSVDWCLGKHMRVRPVRQYAMLNEKLFGARPYRPAIPSRSARAEVALRVRVLESWSGALNALRLRATEPYMVTMARGKAGDLGPLRMVWRDAYGAISRAEHLEIVGYSMPPDDIEIRTLLRAGVQRGRQDLEEVMVRNPAPDVHDRVRRYLDRAVRSDYRGIAVV
jgi:hypothetical protein